MVLSCLNRTEKKEEPFSRQAMSSYLPIRHNAPVKGDEFHTAENTGYMDHFLNIPEICPSGADFRSPRYYMGSYNADACRMDALQQRNHELRLGLQGNRPSFYPGMTVASNLRFRENCGDVGQTNITNSKNEPISPCTQVTGATQGSESDTPAFYPWMSIVG